MPKLVSVIIPCFNAEKWVAEAIESCLNQTYSNMEIIVVDDGSTDNSLEIIKSYGTKIKWETFPHNKGGNQARNRGFALSKGEYIQFLDADDYILPNKIEQQVQLLEQTEADVVYSDWRHKQHLPDGTSYLDRIEVAGAQADILESLLEDWWTATASLLYRRTVVEESGGWDESLVVAQDRDFFLTVVLNGAKVVYLPGCSSIYRRHGDMTVSTASKLRWIEYHCIVMRKAEKKLQAMNKFSTKYRQALAKCYFQRAREALKVDYSLYLQLLDTALTLYPDFQADSKRKIYQLTQKIFGFRQTERIACYLLLLRKLVNSIIPSLSRPTGLLDSAS
jgi:glycosyltransferase involved in cell wall biosynthesis